MSNKGDIAYCNSQFKKQKHWSEISEEKFCLLLGSCGKLLRVLTLIYTDAEETVYYTEVKTPSFYKVNDSMVFNLPLQTFQIFI